jgi:hypothetical protein
MGTAWGEHRLSQRHNGGWARAVEMSTKSLQARDGRKPGLKGFEAGLRVDQFLFCIVCVRRGDN